VAACPETLWDEPADRNRFWLVAYHALFYTHLYLHPTEDDFVPWTKLRVELRTMEPTDAPPYTRGETLEFLDLVEHSVGELVPTLDWTGVSGFHWIPLNKLELQFYNIRHLQAHTGELAERLWARAGIETHWVGQA
jgi:hypothetical protein